MHTTLKLSEVKQRTKLETFNVVYKTNCMIMKLWWDKSGIYSVMYAFH